MEYSVHIICFDSRFLNHFQSTSLIHKEMLAILAAVTDVIKQKGGTESSTEYYAALVSHCNVLNKMFAPLKPLLKFLYQMTTLESAESEESVAAILSLLGMGLKTVPKSVLKLQFGQASQIFFHILTKFADSENFLILRHVSTPILHLTKMFDSRRIKFHLLL